MQSRDGSSMVIGGRNIGGIHAGMCLTGGDRSIFLAAHSADPCANNNRKQKD
jgi:hypothetical protein